MTAVSQRRALLRFGGGRTYPASRSADSNIQAFCGAKVLPFSSALCNSGLTGPATVKDNGIAGTVFIFRLLGESVRRLITVVMAAGVVCAAGAFVWAAYSDRAASESVQQDLRPVLEGLKQSSMDVALYREAPVPRGYAFANALLSFGIDRAYVYPITESVQPVFDLRRVRAGNRLAVGESVVGDLRQIVYRIDLENTLLITPAEGVPGRFRAEIMATPAVIETVTAVGELKTSLWEAVLDAGETPEMVMLIADIFGWDIDFNTEPRVGDTFRVAFEKKTYADGSIAYGRVFAAEYVNEGQNYQAVLFRDARARPAYYAPDGSSLQKMFLRSPLVFGGRVTSRFSRSRFHPILKRRRPHLGIDYGAPAGSPVQAIGSGRVLFAGRKGGGGRTVHIRHSNGFETMYLHLSRVLVRAGQRVDQGQRIGLVGSTGLSTGPHLDFRITQNGTYRNFEALRLPPAVPVAKSDFAEFAVLRDGYLAMLPPPIEPGLQRAGARPVGAPTASGQ